MHDKNVLCAAGVRTGVEAAWDCGIVAASANIMHALQQEQLQRCCMAGQFNVQTCLLTRRAAAPIVSHAARLQRLGSAWDGKPRVAREAVLNLGVWGALGGS